MKYAEYTAVLLKQIYCNLIHFIVPVL